MPHPGHHDRGLRPIPTDGRAVVVGASLAGLRGAEALRREGWTGSITVVGDEGHEPYDRPPLSKQVLAGQQAPEQARLRRDESAGVELRTGVAAAGLDLDVREVVLEDGTRLPFDRLLVATGASPRPLPGTTGLDGVHVLRTLDDSLRLRAALAADPPPAVAVIGAGFIGAEVASTARSLGCPVTMVEALAVPLSRVLGDELGAVCADLHRRAGTDLRLGTEVDAVEPTGAAGDAGTGRPAPARRLRVRLADGSAVEVDVVVVGIGVVPATSWLAGSGLAVDGGVVCDPWLRVRSLAGGIVEGVCAAGDVARWEHPDLGRPVRVEHWTNAVEQGAAAAAALVHGAQGREPFRPVPYFWSDQYGHKIQHVGHTSPTDEVVVVEGAPAEGPFVAAIGRAGRLVGAFAVDRPARIMAWRARVAAGEPFPPA